MLEQNWSERGQYLTTRPMRTREVDAIVAARIACEFQQFCSSEQHELIELIGQSVCGGGWSRQVSDMCFRSAALELQACLSDTEVRVVKELYQRITRPRVDAKFSLVRRMR